MVLGKEGRERGGGGGDEVQENCGEGERREHY